MNFFLNGDARQPTACDGNRTLLDYLRGDAGLKGTKEGCASGDCGACTVLLRDGTGPLRAVNSCITPLGKVNRLHVYTVEALSCGGGSLHPVQQAMVDCHGSQCGFCTPGFVMALTGLYHNSRACDRAELDRDAVTDAISGNLCRCTGYRPIVEAGTKMLHSPYAPHATLPAPKTALAPAMPMQAILDDSRHGYYQPASEGELQQLLKLHPAATLVAGATDLGLELSQRFRQYPVLIDVTAIASLREIGWREDCLRIGAALPYTDLENFLAPLSRPVHKLLHRLGSRQIRNQGTVGGNIANGSPIADMPPALLAWDAQVEIVDAAGKRQWHPMHSVYLGYRKTVLKPGQYLACIRIPQAAINRPHRFYKLSKRFEDDISAVLGAFSLDLQNGHIAQARVAFGGVAATPVRAANAEAALSGQALTDFVIDSACRALAEELHPISDVRASAAYRIEGACNLLRRALLELRDGADFDVHHYPAGNEAALYAQAD